MSLTKITDADFKASIDSKPYSLIKFYADWCGSCKLIAPKFRRLSDNENYKDVAFFEANAEENAELRKWAGVSNLPYFAVVKNGELVKGDSTSKIEVVEDLLKGIID